MGYPGSSSPWFSSAKLSGSMARSCSLVSCSCPSKGTRAPDAAWFWWDFLVSAYLPLVYSFAILVLLPAFGSFMAADSLSKTALPRPLSLLRLPEALRLRSSLLFKILFLRFPTSGSFSWPSLVRIRLDPSVWPSVMASILLPARWALAIASFCRALTRSALSYSYLRVQALTLFGFCSALVLGSLSLGLGWLKVAILVGSNGRGGLAVSFSWACFLF